MKAFRAILFFVLLGISLSSKLTEETLLDSDKECIEDLGLGVQTILDGINDGLISTVGDSNMEKFTECTYRKLNAIDNNDDIEYDVVQPIFASYFEFINKNIDADQASKNAIESCKSLKDYSNLGDRLVKFGNCVFKQAKNN